MFFWIGSELFSGQSPSGVYGKALKECLNNTEVSTISVKNWDDYVLFVFGELYLTFVNFLI